MARLVPSGALREKLSHASALASGGCLQPQCSFVCGSITPVSASDFHGLLLHVSASSVSFCVLFLHGHQSLDLGPPHCCQPHTSPVRPLLHVSMLFCFQDEAGAPHSIWPLATCPALSAAAHALCSHCMKGRAVSTPLCLCKFGLISLGCPPFSSPLFPLHLKNSHSSFKLLAPSEGYPECCGVCGLLCPGVVLVCSSGVTSKATHCFCFITVRLSTRLSS